jgi:hypothetical protein
LRDELAERRIPLIAVLLPIRSVLEADDPTRLDSYEQGRRVEDLTRSLGIRTLDPSEHFRALVQQHGSSRYFLTGDDIHLNQEGHAAMAQWLVENVTELGGAAAEDPNDRQGMAFPRRRWFRVS